MSLDQLTQLTPGMPILVGGDRITYVSDELAAAFQPGDRLLVVQETGDLLHIPASSLASASEAVGRAHSAFEQMGSVPDVSISLFYEQFAAQLGNDAIWAKIKAANDDDVERAKARGRSTTRLIATDGMRRAMIAGLREWRDAASVRGKILERVEHDGWTVDLVTAPLGVVGFVFEGRPNVFADATGVLRGGNTVVFRIGSDALGTAKAIMEHALQPALTGSKLPPGAVSLVDSASHAAGWAMFSDTRLALAVARGSGKAVAQLGSVARQSGVPVSLHGTGGAWLVAAEDADAAWFGDVVTHSLDRKVCNTLNVCCIPKARVDLVGAFIQALTRSGEKDARGYRLHVVAGDEGELPGSLFTRTVCVRRAEGETEEPIADVVPIETLATEWEWEGTPEVTLKLVGSLDEAVALCNTYSPRFVATLVSGDRKTHERFYETVNTPFVGNGFTRWVDGQFTLNRPELGLSNWQNGRLFARGGILSGDGIYTVRTRATQTRPDVHR